MESLTSLPASVPGLFDPSLSIKVVEVAKKYEEPEVRPSPATPGRDVIEEYAEMVIWYLGDFRASLS